MPTRPNGWPCSPASCPAPPPRPGAAWGCPGSSSPPCAPASRPGWRKTPPRRRSWPPILTLTRCPPGCCSTACARRATSPSAPGATSSAAAPGAGSTRRPGCRSRNTSREPRTTGTGGPNSTKSPAAAAPPGLVARRAARRPVLGALHPRPARARQAERRGGGQEAAAAVRRAAAARHRRRPRPVLRGAVPPPPGADRDRARPAGQRGGRPRDRRRRRDGRPGAVQGRRRDRRRPGLRRPGQWLRRGALLQPRAPPGPGPDPRPVRQGPRGTGARRHAGGDGRLRRPGPPRVRGGELPRPVRLPQLGLAGAHPRAAARLAPRSRLRRPAPRPRAAHPRAVPVRGQEAVSWPVLHVPEVSAGRPLAG